MENEETITETDADSQSQKPKTSRLAIMSMVFGILGPFFFGAMWIVSFLSFHDLIIASPYITTLFSCGVTWILGLALGMKSLERIKNSEGQLVGRGYAVVGISASAVWMILVLAALILPALYYVNS
jgi:hypothetical protein